MPKTTDTTVSEKSTEAKKTEKGKAAPETPGIYAYIGPNIKGVIQQNTIYEGTYSGVCEKIADAAEKYPLITGLIVPAAALTQSRREIKTTGTRLNHKYVQLARQINGGN